MTFGLIGFPLSHSFSKKYFTEKFEKERLKGFQYKNFELENINEFENILLENPEIKGLNVTIPYKMAVIPFLDELDASAQKVGAVNVIKIEKDKKTGYNSDYYGFLKSLKSFFPTKNFDKEALILGNGGAAKAVKSVLEDLGIYFTFVSRNPKEGMLAYAEISGEKINQTGLIINTTPLGMYPNIGKSPAIPYELLNEKHYLYDLIYNPEKTLFMKKGLEQKSKVINGLQMLVLQAEKSWEIWNT